MPDAITEARAALLQPLLLSVARLMPAPALAELRAEVTALRDQAARRDTPAGRAMAEACDMALADLSAGMAHHAGQGG